MFCCAFQILDEVQRILYYIKESSSLGRAYKVTDELFDLSTMAMEYFKDHIEPTLPEITFFGAEFLDFTTPSLSFSSKYFLIGHGMRLFYINHLSYLCHKTT